MYCKIDIEIISTYLVIGINDRSHNFVGGEVKLLNLLTIGAKDIDMGSQIFP